MNAQEWLESVQEGDHLWLNDYILMERYANYISRNYQVKIMAFRNELDNLNSTAGGSIIICPKDSLGGFEVKSYYDNFFEIETLRYGTTE